MYIYIYTYYIYIHAHELFCKPFVSIGVFQARALSFLLFEATASCLEGPPCTGQGSALWAHVPLPVRREIEKEIEMEIEFKLWIDKLRILLGLRVGLRLGLGLRLD